RAPAPRLELRRIEGVINIVVTTVPVIIAVLVLRLSGSWLASGLALVVLTALAVWAQRRLLARR
ncbi:MAG: hypothetical protein H7Y32_19480, partial [Chloroflexales bacterium]|nr:hypothetical protein [Chloroflexales bacterium]